MDDLPGPALPSRSHFRTAGGNAAFHNFHNDYSHIQDPNSRRRLALSEIDKVPFGWYHVRAVVVAGSGFFTDSYDIFTINLVTATLGMVYWQGEAGGINPGLVPSHVNTALKTAASGGAVIGQLVFGLLADIVGRRKMYGMELAIVVAATLAQALTAPSVAMSMTGLLVFWRIMMGIGIGGDYPLSAVITSEFAPTRWRGAMMAAVFSMQGAGQLAATIVALITTVGFKDSFIGTTGEMSSCHEACQLAGDKAWRIIIGFGALPACFALYYRITIPETPRYTFDVAHDIEKAQADITAYVNNEKEGQVDPFIQQRTKRGLGSKLTAPAASWSDVISYFSKWKNFKVIFGTAMSWYCLDLAYYGLELNNSIVLAAIGYSAGNTIYETLLNTAMGNLILVCAGSIPGYWLCVVTVDTIGRKPLQILGFFFLTIVFIIIAFAYNSLSEGALLGLYILAQMLFNWGPNTTTFLIPGECFPTRYRSTGHGLSAAAGKIGSIIAQIIAQPLLTKGPHIWLPHVMRIFALFMFQGILVSFLVPETRGRTLEEIAGEEESSRSLRGSFIKATGWRGWWGRNNPFRGGKPAGFWGRIEMRCPRLRGKRERVGIMTSPELVPRKKGGQGMEASGGLGYSVSIASGVEHTGNEGANDDLYLSGAVKGTLPGWGAGWGVQRGDTRRDGEGLRKAESILLNDVGSLLK